MDINYKYLDTPVGKMIACATQNGVCLLEFDNRKDLNKQLERIKETLDSEPTEKDNAHLSKLEAELADYFQGNLKEFTVSLDMVGTDFQKQVWNELLKIPYGKTVSYQQQANSLGNPKSVRAVANANGMNKIAIIIPCHRVIGTNGTLTGYAGGLDKKRWLLNLENQEKDLFN
ncbi:MAG: methylated-DNA--[protein]-cysteine S-methyltransferase [Dysgonomonas sp.]|nr:methylated-DNA--[protein]-cysteine S-methyltransferase [Dysgonomonas sp.]